MDSVPSVSALDTSSVGEGGGSMGYGETFADVYDDWYGELGDVDAVVEAIADWVCDGRRGLADGDARGLADGAGRVLELGVGTGRLAIPLAKRGQAEFTVEGVDNSVAMLERLRANDPERLVRATHCDMSKTLPPGPFDVIFAAYNTLLNLLTEQAQRACLALAARRLSATGNLVIEAFVPRTDFTSAGEAVPSDARDDSTDERSLHQQHALRVDGGIGVDAAAPPTAVRRVNRVTRFGGDPRDGRGDDQRVDGEIVVLADDASPHAPPEVRPWSIRYVTPTQLDVMARAVGLELAERHATWSGEPFTPHSAAHVSRYTKLR